jgi:hypothetical protein
MAPALSLQGLKKNPAINQTSLKRWRIFFGPLKKYFKKVCSWNFNDG